MSDANPLSFQALTISDWRQFADVSIQFHPRMTVITGANGSGKTTLLNILAKHFNWNPSLVGTPRRTPSGETFYRLERKRKDSSDVAQQAVNMGGINYIQPPQSQLGTLSYSDGVIATITAPVEGGQSYYTSINPQLAVQGLYVPSHKQQFLYTAVQAIPTRPFSKAQVYLEYFNTISQRYFGGHSQKAPNQVMKESLIAFAVFGGGNPFMPSDEQALSAFIGFQDILRKLLPVKFGFESISIRNPEVILETKGGAVSLDAVSGGVGSIIDLAWRLFMYSPTGDRFVCIMDEPENHLHPELQQTLLPNLVATFPNVQFIVATHSPFMVTAVDDSFVYVLNVNESGGVTSSMLQQVNRAGSANEILRDVLGLPFTMPLWAESRLTQIVSKYEKAGVDGQNIDALEEELNEAGLGSFYASGGSLGGTA